MHVFDALPTWGRLALLYFTILLGLPGAGYMMADLPQRLAGRGEIVDDVMPRVTALERLVDTMIEEHETFRRDQRETRDMIRHTFCSVMLTEPDALEFQDCLSNVEMYMRRSRNDR